MGSGGETQRPAPPASGRGNQIPGGNRSQQQCQADEVDTPHDAHVWVLSMNASDADEAPKRSSQLDLKGNHQQLKSTVRRVQVYARKRPAAMVAAHATNEATASIFVMRDIGGAEGIRRTMDRKIAKAIAINPSFR